VRYLALLAILCGVLLLAGSMGKADALKISTREDRRVMTVTVTAFSITPAYRWVSLYGCTAEVQEHGTFCTGDFERESTQEVRETVNQYPFEWRNLPRGTMQFTAMVFDQDGKRLAVNQKTVLRQ
jgi:hypothetical protein